MSSQNFVDYVKIVKQKGSVAGRKMDMNYMSSIMRNGVIVQGWVVNVLRIHVQIKLQPRTKVVQVNG